MSLSSNFGLIFSINFWSNNLGERRGTGAVCTKSLTYFSCPRYCYNNIKSTINLGVGPEKKVQLTGCSCVHDIFRSIFGIAENRFEKNKRFQQRMFKK